MSKYSLDVSNKFKKDFRLCMKRGLPIDKIQKAMDLLAQTGSLPSEYSPH